MWHLNSLWLHQNEEGTPTVLAEVIGGRGDDEEGPSMGRN
jgi:hypothetical protein